MRSNDQQLIKALKAGKENAYRQLYEKHYSLLCGIAYNYTNDTFIAEEIVSEVMVNLYSIRENLDIKVSLRKYLSTAVRYRCLNYLLSQSKHPEVNFSELDDTARLMKVESGLPLGTLLEAELEEKVKAAIRTIPIDSRRVFMLSRFHEMTYVEISERLGISVNTVKYHIKQALAHLRKELETYLKK